MDSAHMTLSDLKKIIEGIESDFNTFDISVVTDAREEIGYLCFANEMHGELPYHPAIVLKNGMLAINLSWNPDELE